jgi:hypothetical protein
VLQVGTGEGPVNEQVETYRHTQIGWVLLAVLAAGAGVVVFASGKAGWSAASSAVLTLLVIVALLFCTLTVRVGGGEIECRYGPGLVSKHIPLGAVQSVRPVRTEWYQGWGIRLTSDGWLFNVSGLDAVEVELTDGKRIRIGTDEPQALVAAIRGHRP